jgi:tetratricopeptide (TPR) repeat protein
MRRVSWISTGVAGLGLLLIAWAYWPGLSGPFLFDDFGSLNVLGNYGQLHDWPSFLYYLTSGTSDPTGRPLSLLSFLLDARAWPADPRPFKQTNLILHLCNAALLGWAVARLQDGVRRRHPHIEIGAGTPILAALLWAAHPFFVSTTLYAIQREAMLPMAFVLLAMLAWDQATRRFVRQRTVSAWTWALAGFGTATLLATLSKANGVLAPVLTGLGYLWFLRPAEGTAARASADRAALVCLAVPALVVVAYLALVGYQQWGLPVVYGRDWSLPQRLLSEPRALWSYLGKLALPRAGGGGLFVEDFAASRGWLDPVSTLPAALALVVSIVAAIRLGNRFPIASFAWLFYLAGQLMESTTVPLELYFEHRNYLPAAMLGWPIAHGLLKPGAYRRYRFVFALALSAALLLLTHLRAEVWGNPALLTALSATHEAGSERAQVSAARDEIERGAVASGLARIHSVLREHPESIDVVISAIGMECNTRGALDADTLARARAALRNARDWNYGLYEWLQASAADPVMQRCRGFGLDGLESLVSAAEANPQSRLSTRQRDLRHVRGRIAIARGDTTAALQWFDSALRAQPDADYALVQAAALGDAGAPALGVRHLDAYRRLEEEGGALPPDMTGLHRWLLRHYGYYDRELSDLRARLARDTGNPQ